MAIVEASLLAVALSPQNQSTSSLGFIVLGFSFIAGLFGNSFASTYEWNLRKSTRDPQRTWLFLHAIYWIAAILNGFILYGLLLFYVTVGKFAPNWPLVTGFAVITAVMANHQVMLSLGQGYEDLRGYSLEGAAAFARLGRGMLESKNRHGIIQLVVSINIARALFRNRAFVPRDIDAVSATLRALTATDPLAVEGLSSVALSLEEMPQLDTLPNTFKNFLDALVWPRGFDHLGPPRKYSDYPKLTILLTLVLASAAIIALFSEPARQATLLSLGNFLIQNLIELFGALSFLPAFVMVLRSLRRPVPVLALKYWPRKKPNP